MTFLWRSPCRKIRQPYFMPRAEQESQVIFQCFRPKPMGSDFCCFPSARCAIRWKAAAIVEKSSPGLRDDVGRLEKSKKTVSFPRFGYRRTRKPTALICFCTKITANLKFQKLLRAKSKNTNFLVCSAQWARKPLGLLALSFIEDTIQWKSAEAIVQSAPRLRDDFGRLAWPAWKPASKKQENCRNGFASFWFRKIGKLMFFNALDEQGKTTHNFGRCFWHRDKENQLLDDVCNQKQKRVFYGFPCVEGAIRWTWGTVIV